MARALINVPAKAKRGEVIAIKTLISHVMESGFRRSSTEIFRATLFPAIAANPFIAFHTVAVESGTIEFEWTGDNGYAVTEQAKIIVE